MAVQINRWRRSTGSAEGSSGESRITFLSLNKRVSGMTQAALFIWEISGCDCSPERSGAKAISATLLGRRDNMAGLSLQHWWNRMAPSPRSSRRRADRLNRQSSRLLLEELEGRCPPSLMFTTFDVPGSTRTEARGINASGQIVGDYFDAGGKGTDAKLVGQFSVSSGRIV